MSKNPRKLQPIRGRRAIALIVLAMCLGLGLACWTQLRRPPVATARSGDEIVVFGKYVHTGAPVVLWSDSGGYNGYESDSSFGVRSGNAAGIDQFVFHYDQCGSSRTCFSVLQSRKLSVHFMLDLDGTIYQTLDVKERAFHATKANDRSIGIEIANVGAYSADERDPFAQWYAVGTDGKLRLTIPAAQGDGGIRTPGFIGRPIREQIVRGTVQGSLLRQYDFTPQQYDSLIKLTAALCRAFPKIQCDYPRDRAGAGQLIPHQFTDTEFDKYHGLLGHYHIQSNKVDPGPAFQWDRVVDGARKLLR